LSRDSSQNKENEVPPRVGMEEGQCEGPLVF